MLKRDIVFRGKSKNTGEWVFGNLFDKDNIGRTHIGTTVRMYFDIDPETVGQFTGMTDKTGKKIFEGDIIKWIDSDGNNRIDKVLFSNGGFHLCNIYYNIGGYKGNSLEVIGNIHDNKELLS